MKRAIIMICLAAAWSVSAQAQDTVLKMHGSDTIGAKLAPTLVKAWLTHDGYKNISEKQPAALADTISAVSPQGNRLTIEIESHGSGTGISDLSKQDIDIAMASRAITADEMKNMPNLNRIDSADNEFVLGLDGIAVIVNKKNPISALTISQVRDLFSGAAGWAAVGGHGTSVNVYALDENSGTYDTFKSLVLGKGASLTSRAARFASVAEVAAKVAADPNGIGFVSVTGVGNAKAIAVGDAGAAPMEATTFGIATEDYPLTRRLYLYLPQGSENAEARTFIEYALSDSGQAIVGQTGFVSQQIITSDQRPPKDAPDEYKQLVAKAQRLSVVFRFKPGSATLDNKAKEDLKRVASFMKAPANKNRQLILIGFANPDNLLPLHSIGLSVTRADNVSETLSNLGVRTKAVRGYGPAVLVSDKDTATGRAKNTRVEVWIE